MKYQTQKNLTCLLITLTGIFTSITIVVNFYIANQSNSDINTISQLTGSNVKIWGAYPGYNNLNLNKTVKFFPLNVDDAVTVAQMPAGINCNAVDLQSGNSYYYNHNVLFKNISLQTGSGGYATYYKNETMEDQGTVDEVAAQIEKSQGDVMMMPNQGMMQGYYEEVYAPIARKMPLYLYNLKRQMMDTLPTYYAKEFQIFNLGDEAYTKATVFTPLGITAENQDKLWTDEFFGWSNMVTLGKWVSIVLSQQYANHPTYGQIQNYFTLSDDVMTGLAGKASMLNKLSWLLNGTLSDSLYVYGNSACEGIGLYCDNSELASSQWAQGILTTKQIFKYNKNPDDYNFCFHDLNSTIPVNAELGIFAPSNINANDGMNLLQIDPSTDDMWSPLTAGKTITLISYYNMANLYNNKNNYGLINFNLKLYDVTKVAPLVSYLDNLEQNLILKNDIYPGLGTQTTVTTAWFMYRSFTKLFNQISDITISNLYGRAAYNNMHYNGVACASLFTLVPADPVLATLAKICTNRSLKTQFDVTSSITANIPFVFAFIGNQGSNDYQNLLNKLKVTSDQLSYFLYNTNKSPYAILLAKIQTYMSKYYKCLSYCTANELAITQWFNAGITTNLPVDDNHFFQATDQVPSILNWDINNAIPRKMLPEINLYAQTVYQTTIQFNTYNQNNLLNTNTGSILTWSSLHDLIIQVTSQNQAALLGEFLLSFADANIILEYLKHTVVEGIFGGVYVQDEASDFLWGYDDQFLLQKAAWKQTDGGQPWISTKRSLLQRNNWQAAANLVSTQVFWVDTGLEDMSGVNNVEKVMGSTSLYYNYYVWSTDSTYSNSISSIVLPYGLNQTVSGSTGFAFSTQISDDATLTLLDDKYLRVQPLIQNDTGSYAGQKVYQYILDDSETQQQIFYDQPGLLNMTASAFNSLFISNLFFSQIPDPYNFLNILIQGQPMLTSPVVKQYPTANMTSFRYVEPESGKTLQYAQNDQHNLLFTNSLLLDAYHVTGTCYIPYIWDLVNMNYASDLVSNTFSDLNSSQSTKKALLITFIVLTCVSFVGACIMFFFTFKSFQRLRFQNEHESNSLEEPILQGNQKNYNSSSNNNNTGSIERTFNEKNANIQAQD